MLAKLLVKLANSRLGVPAKSLMRRLQETYYNAEVLSRPVTKIAPLSVNVSASAKSRVNILNLKKTKKITSRRYISYIYTSCTYY